MNSPQRVGEHVLGAGRHDGRAAPDAWGSVDVDLNLRLAGVREGLLGKEDLPHRAVHIPESTIRGGDIDAHFQRATRGRVALIAFLAQGIRGLRTRGGQRVLGVDEPAPFQRESPARFDRG